MTTSDGVSSAGTYGFKNRIINGAMVINQRGSSSYSVSGQYYTLDRWEGNILGGGTGTFTVTQPSVTLSGFTKALLVTVGTADSSQSANAAYSIEQQIEGYNIADLNFGTANAKAVTLSFWVYSSVTGTFPLVIQNGGNTRSYGTTYTISSANTWQKITITVAGDTTGTWATDNTSGLLIHWGLGGGGSTRTAPSGWSTAASINQTMVSGCVSLMATSGATWYVTGVQLEVGSTATSFDYRPYGTELALCQRYYYQSTGASGGSGYPIIATGSFTGTTGIDMMATVPVPMRVTPSVSYSGQVYVQSGATAKIISSIVAVYGGFSNIYIAVGCSTGTFTAGYAGILFIQNSAGNNVTFSSEL
jgi:hypothetical protein